MNIWLENDEGVALSRWRVQLLQEIDRSGSINAAARALNVPYRLAWDRLHEMEERLHVHLVDTVTGGRGGGGSTLTPAAQQIIVQFLALADAIETSARVERDRFFPIAPRQAIQG